ncbi:hypothetical protein FA743_14680 [Paracoccus gahaiensis]|uniref:Uncharacterized protein n=1 Tax=Paracoccus gahaiensis TaxID=1706839 RepID=A0A4U0R7A1_9RHOB|nr:hypothetical protein FA743_14680 [Paracoccus gahaiensis]
MPSSPCLRTNAFCASVNLDAFIVLSSSPSQGRLTENSSFKRSSFQGAEQPLRCSPTLDRRMQNLSPGSFFSGQTLDEGCRVRTSLFLER